MQPNLISEAQLVLIVAALVAAVREQFPKIDGKAFVLGLAIVVSEALCFLIGGDTVRNIIQHGILIALTTAGGMHVVGYHATKAAEGQRLSMPPAPRMPSIKPLAGVLLLALGVTLATGTSTGCSGVQKRDVKSVVDVVKSLVEEVCSPEDPTLDACIDKLLSSPKVKAARAAARKADLDGGK